jgi:RNA recognition motif-containing protein
MNESKLFVGNLSYETQEHDLQDYFAQAGNVTTVTLMLDKFSGKSRGFAFVEFASAEDAAKAVEQFNQKEFQGRQLTVNIARPREDRPPRSSGGNSRYRDERPNYRNE